MRAAANGDPIGFVEGLPARTIIDEVQRAPGIFTSLKAVIDRRRTAGRFILTGSANVMFVPRVADSLAGRIGLLRLHPLAQCEIERHAPRFLDTLFRGNFRTRIAEPLGISLARRIVAARRVSPRGASLVADLHAQQGRVSVSLLQLDPPDRAPAPD